MVAIRIIDHVKQPSSYEDGQLIFNLIRDDVRNGKGVEVSFEGLHAVPSAFINAALVQLVESMPMQQIFSSLKITHSTKFINDLIKRRFAFVADQDGSPH